jgi:hypothetical protein
MNFGKGYVVQIGNFFGAEAVYFMMGHILEQAVFRPHKGYVEFAAPYAARYFARGISQWALEARALAVTAPVASIAAHTTHT